MKSSSGVVELSPCSGEWARGGDVVGQRGVHGGESGGEDPAVGLGE